MHDIEYKVGMRVRDRYDREYLGEVVEVVDVDEIHVKWDKDPETIQRHDPYEISPFDPEGDKIKAQKTQAKIDEATSLLEAAFKAWNEAQVIFTGYSGEGAAGEFDIKNGIDVSKFEGVAENFGWNTSSLYC